MTIFLYPVEYCAVRRIERRDTFTSPVTNETCPRTDAAPYAAVPPPCYDFDYGHRLLISRLSDPVVFSRLRLFLAYFEERRDVCLVSGESYVSLRSYLESSGLPLDNHTLRKVYFEFLRFRGLTDEEIQEDLSLLGGVTRGRYLDL
ncbi:hypothetical protein WDU94_010751 [Cyamophila willieti]